MMREIEPENVNSRAAQGAVTLLDVSSAAEFAELHAGGARNLPFGSDELDRYLSARAGTACEPVYVMCRGGVRSAAVCEQHPAAGLVNVRGGTRAWTRKRLPVERQRGIGIERQVRIAAGLLTLIGVVLGVGVHLAWLALAAAVGAGLTYAGVTGSCAMGILLSRMPWNRPAPRRAPVTSRAQ